MPGRQQCRPGIPLSYSYEGVIHLSAPSLFRSRYAAYRVKIRSAQKHYHPATGVLIRDTPEMVAEFAQHNGEFKYQDENGMERTGADIRGHFYDLDADAFEKGWTDEEKDLARTVLLRVCDRFPGDMWVHETPKVAAPWPTYDETHHNKIPVLAVELGLLDESLEYERQNKNRDSVVAALEEKKQQSVAARELTAA